MGNESKCTVDDNGVMQESDGTSVLVIWGPEGEGFGRVAELYDETSYFTEENKMVASAHKIVSALNGVYDRKIEDRDARISSFHKRQYKLEAQVRELEAQVKELKTVTIKNKIKELSEKQAIIQKLEKKLAELIEPECQHLNIEDTGWEIGPRQRCLDCGAGLNTKSTTVFVNTNKDKE